MTNDDIKRLRELCDKATKGPWLHLPPEAVGGHAIAPPKGPAVIPNCWGTELDDAEFVCAARTAIPALLDEVERLRDELAEAEKRLRRVEWRRINEQR